MDAAFPLRTYSVDWGSGRGRGRRSNGMVMGAMGDPPRGRRTYRDLLSQFGLPDSARVDVYSLEASAIEDYWRARTAGMRHDEAMGYAWAREAAPGGQHPEERGPEVKGDPR